MKNNRSDYTKEEPQSDDDMGPGVLIDEILAAIGKMKNNKAKGIDEISIEMLETFGEKAANELMKLCKDKITPEHALRTFNRPFWYYRRINQRQ